jgi:hypothetical protein
MVELTPPSIYFLYRSVVAKKCPGPGPNSRDDAVD